jgi:hypothetical protein
LARLVTLGALAPLLPAGADVRGVPETVRAADHAIEELSERHPGFSARREIVLLAVLAVCGTRKATAKWLRHLHIGRDQAAVALQIAEPGSVVLRALQSPRGMRDSRLFRLLHPLAAETLVVVWTRGGALARERVERFLGELSGVRLAVGGADLIAMGAAPGAGFSAILARALDDRLDGRAVGREAELANLRRLATKVGLLGSRKDRA